MMHNILWSNWQRDQLPNVLISNSFEILTMARRNQEDYITRIAKHCSETPLENDYENQNVFNDLSLHTFPRDSLPLADDEAFWTRSAAPLKVNKDELITEADASFAALKL